MVGCVFGIKVCPIHKYFIMKWLHMPVLQPSLMQTWCKQAQCVALRSAPFQVETLLIVRHCRYCRDIVAICLFWIVFDLDLVHSG